MRVLRCALFAVAATAVVLGSGGLVVVPHREPTGSGSAHQHAVTVYRFPLALLGDAPGVPRADELAHHVAAVHVAHLRALLGLPGESLAAIHPLAELAAGTVLALLILAVPRLPRPARRAIAEISFPATPTPQWRSLLASPPPRVRVFATA